MTQGEHDVPERIRLLVEAIESFISSIPEEAIDGSPRHVDESALRGTSDNSAESRVSLMLDAQQSAALKVVAQSFFARGIADLLEVAAGRLERAVNGPSLAVLARSTAEATALIVWLLDPKIEASERSRRSLIYLFDDLKYKIAIAGDREDAALTPDLARAFRDLDDEEAQLVGRAQDAACKARPRSTVSGSTSGPGLIREDEDKLEKMPNLSDLVRDTYEGNPFHYAAMSAEAHAARFAVLAGRSGNDTYAGLLSPSFSLSVLTHSLAKATNTIATWTGASNTGLARPLQDLSAAI